MALLGLIVAATLSSPAPVAPQQDFLRSHMDFSVNPGIDFFEYANGGWLKRHPIPASESGWGIGNAVNDEINLQLRTLSENAAKKLSKPGSDEQKTGDFWATAMDEAKAEKLGISPLQPQLDRIGAIDSVQKALDVAFDLQRSGVNALFGFGIYQDEKKSDQMAVHLGQGGLGLPDRDFYFNEEAGVAKIRTEYAKHLENMLRMAGSADPADTAAKVMEFETALAKVSRKLEDTRDPEKNYNKMTVRAVTAKLTPSVAWGSRLGKWNIHPANVIVGQPEFFKGLESLLKETPVETLRDYLRFHLVSEYAPYLNKELDEENFHFYSQVLSGQQKQRPRWKRALRAENGAIGFVLGRAFVKRYFPPAAKRRYAHLVEAIREAYSARIDRLDWMSPATKRRAHQKLATIVKKVGYPDKWKDYSKLHIGRSSYAENMMNASRWNFDDAISKLNKPVDRTEWEMTPQTYNAYYNPSNNEIVLPAAAFAIPGLRDAEVDDAVVYGYAGASTIGHEMTHGFDDSGRQFDAQGNLKDWWTKADGQRFQQRAEVMVKEFNAYEPLPGLHINGKASLGENIADYGGILLGLDAFKKTKQYREGTKIGGLTPLQRFFLGYALGWMSQTREQSLRRQLLSDVHAPAKWRVLGPMSNIPEFYQAFGIKPGQPMWRPAGQQVRIW